MHLSKTGQQRNIGTITQELLPYFLIGI